MHPYAAHTARWKTVGVLMFISIGLASLLSSVVRTIGYQLGFQWGTVSAFAVFTAVYWCFDRYVWRWPIIRRLTAPSDLNGDWVGEIKSSSEKEPSVETNDETSDEEHPTITITQTWSRIEVVMTNPGSSRSESTSATFRTHKSDSELLFTYVNKPVGEVASELNMHEGTNTLRYTQGVDGSDFLEGEYYTDEQRNNHGVMRFERIAE